MINLRTSLRFVWFLGGVTLGMALSVRAFAADRPDRIIVNELKKKFPNAEVELTSRPVWSGYGDAREVTVHRITFSGETTPGNYAIQLETMNPDGAINTVGAAASYRVMMKAVIPLQRVQPGQKLKKSDVKVEKVDTTTGPQSSLRGYFLDPIVDVETLESQQTLLENQPILASAVRRIPDVKKGEWVQIQLISGDVTLSTRGQAEEAGYLNQKLRVTSFGTKRLMEGELKSGGIVEVRL